MKYTTQQAKALDKLLKLLTKRGWSMCRGVYEGGSHSLVLERALRDEPRRSIALCQ